MEFIMTPIGLAVIGGIVGAAVLIIVKVKKRGYSTRKKEIELIEGLLDQNQKKKL